MDVVGRYIPTENLMEGKENVLISKGVKSCRWMIKESIQGCRSLQNVLFRFKRRHYIACARLSCGCNAIKSWLLIK